MKKVFLSGVIIISFVVYAVSTAKPMDVVTKVDLPTPTATVTTTEQTTSAPFTSVPSPTQAASSRYKDGEYTGKAADAFYGNIQVKAVISGGRITDVQFLQYPNDQNQSLEINSFADPALTQEAIQAQSANVDIVSRATDSSNAFIESLTSALQQAQL